MKYIISVPYKLDTLNDLDCFSLPFNEISKNDEIIIDLGDVVFLKPPAIMGVLLTIEYLQKNTKFKRIRIIPPKSPAVLEYLYKIGLPGALKTLGDWKIPDYTSDSIPIRPVIPVKRFTNSEEAESIGQDMQMTFHKDFSSISTLFYPCHTVFAELADNVIAHAESNGGFVLAQQYNYKTGPMIEIAICDCGIGIPNSLRKNPEFAESLLDEEAIKEALTPGVSSTGDRLRGYGLVEVENVIKSIHNRVLSIRSSSGYGIVSGDNTVYNKTSFGKCKYLPGCLAHVMIPC